MSCLTSWAATTTRVATGSLAAAAARRRKLSTTLVLQQHPHNNRPVGVLSRRVWQSHAQKLSKKTPKVEKVKPEEKPWPRNVPIAGGVAACIFIPYTLVWMVTSNPTLRQFFGPFIPLDRLRKHFGVLEWDSQSYTDQQEEDEDASLLLPEDGFYQFPVEDSYLVRQQQETIEELENETITATIYLLGDPQIQETKQVPASIKANPRTLAELVGAAAASGPATTECATRVAVEFIANDSVQEERDSAVSGLDMSPVENKPTRSLLQRMSVYSTWHYAPTFGTEEDPGNPKNKATEVDIDVLRLEYTVEKLEQDLRDPNCTRDRDEMQAELKQARRELSRRKWKRRLRLQ